MSYESIEDQYNFHAEELVKIVKSTDTVLEGNVYTQHLTYNVNAYARTKRLNLFNLSKNCEYILEIGFNAGHSCLVFLLANSHSKIYIFDDNYHKYTSKCLEYLQNVFGQDRIIFCIGDSTKTVPSTNLEHHPTLYHIDGGHSLEIASQDMENCYNISARGDIIVLDDTDMIHLAQLWNSYTVPGLLVPYSSDDFIEPLVNLHSVGVKTDS